MDRRETIPDKEAARCLVDIESKARRSSKSIGELSDHPDLLKQYLESSLSNTFSELLFRLTYEIYTEEKAIELWEGIISHRKLLKSQLLRDVGLLVATLDYLSNYTGDISNPKIIDDLQLEAVADIATRDSLTGLYSRSVFEFSLDHMVQNHRIKGSILSLLLMDIDDLKKVNDIKGHQAGDDTLSQVGQIILHSIRKTDFPVRFGGDEFAIIMPDTTLDQAVSKAEKLCKAIYQRFVYCKPSITVSIGAASILKLDVLTTAIDLVRQADKALYKAKATGKNKIVSSNSLI